MNLQQKEMQQKEMQQKEKGEKDAAKRKKRKTDSREQQTKTTIFNRKKEGLVDFYTFLVEKPFTRNTIDTMFAPEKFNIMIILDQKPEGSNEHQNKSSNEHKYHKKSNNNIFIAILFIIAGLVILGKNVGFIDYFIYRFIISWQMLLVAIGVYSLSRGHNTTGIVLTIIGIFFLLPIIPFIPRFQFFGTRDFWPIVFIIIGIVVLINSKKERKMKDRIHQQYFTDSTEYKTENGFVYSNNSFGSIKQIVLDPLFKGATIVNRFGGTILDLRNTSIQTGETYVYVDCNFGGIEIYVPDNWIIKTEVSNMFSGTEDKRYIRNHQSDSPYILVIRGNASFSGIEIKN